MSTELQATQNRPAFADLVTLAQSNDDAFEQYDRATCLEITRNYAHDKWQAARHRHNRGESGRQILRDLTAAADNIIAGVMAFALYQTPHARVILSQTSLCALGGYGRSELCPQSDLDLCLLYDAQCPPDIEQLNKYVLPFLYDLGFRAGYTTQSVAEAVELAQSDPLMFTSYASARHILGDNVTTARAKMSIAEMALQAPQHVLRALNKRLDPENLPEKFRDLYNPEPDIKENVGGLRDYHNALWLILVNIGPRTLDDLATLGYMGADEHLHLIEALDFTWRIRNELHFHTGKNANQLTFDRQKHMAQAFGYGPGTQKSMDRFMQDYFAAARQLRRFLVVASRELEADAEHESDEPAAHFPFFTTKRGGIGISTRDKNWFAENPPRLMELFWECARRHRPLTEASERRVTQSLDVVNAEFRSNEIVRRFFVAICNRPYSAGFTFRQMSQAGLLEAYLPEFGDISNIVRYEDFHSYPVDEHTLRAVEALAQIPEMGGAIGAILQRTMEHLRDPYILVLAILFHDLGKVSGEEHVEAGVTIARQICRRIGMGPEDTERIVFLVKHHMLMTHISIYRDTDDVDIVNQFAETMKSDERLRALFLLSYCDLSAVGPNVWNEWKGALLTKLYLKAERILQGREQVAFEDEFWKLPKARTVHELAPEPLKPMVEDHLRSFGERYLVGVSPDHIVEHMKCLDEARRSGLAIRLTTHAGTGLSEVIVCTQDHPGLFAQIAGCLTSQMLDVEGAVLFTAPDGFVIDCFTVYDAANHRAVTERQFDAFCGVLRKVLLEDADLEQYVNAARKRIFALLQPRVPVRTRVNFDNDSSRTDTVIDVETGDRTGLLYDMAQAIAELHIDVFSARIVTDARRVRDAFYVRWNNKKITDESEQQNIRARLLDAIQAPVAS